MATGPYRKRDGFSVVQDDRPWLRRFDFSYLSTNAYRTQVPVDAILEAMRPEAIVAEFSLSMSSSWRLARDSVLRRPGRPALAFWSHGFNFDRGFKSPTDLGAQVLRLGLQATADANVCYTHEGAAFLRRWLPGDRPVFTAQNTLDIEAYPERTLDRSPADPATPGLLFVGRITPDKRVPLLVEAFRAVRGEIPGARLTIVGDGPDMPLVRAATAGLDGSVRVLGAVYDPLEIARHFQSASLLVYAGSIGLAANHALAYGLPVVLFDEPGKGARHHPEHAYVVDGRTGYRVREPGAAGLASKLIAILSQPQSPRARLSGSIAAYVEEHLQLERMVSAFVELDSHFRRIREDRAARLLPAQ